MTSTRVRLLVLAATLACGFARVAAAAGALHSLWEIHGRHNTVYLLGSIHVLRPQDYPLAPEILDAYAHADGLVMEIDLDATDIGDLQAAMLAGATLPDDQSLPDILGPARYARATSLAHSVGVDLSMFDRFAPWFAAEAISQLQLTALGFQPQSGVEMYFMERARQDHKSMAGLETAADQLALFEGLPLPTQADYLLSSLEEAHSLPAEVDAMVRAWERGDTGWFAAELQTEFGTNPGLARAVLGARNRKWLPKIEKLVAADENYLIIVGTGHLAGPDSVISLLARDGIVAVQH